MQVSDLRFAMLRYKYDNELPCMHAKPHLLRWAALLVCSGAVSFPWLMERSEWKAYSRCHLLTISIYILEREEWCCTLHSCAYHIPMSVVALAYCPTLSLLILTCIIIAFIQSEHTLSYASIPFLNIDNFLSCWSSIITIWLCHSQSELQTDDQSSILI